MTNTQSQEYLEAAGYLAADLSDEQLYEMLADSAGFGADETNRSAEGKMLFSRIWRKFKRHICENAVIKLYITNPNASDTTAVLSQILNVLINLPGINVAIVAALSFRIGLRCLCADSENGY